MQVGDLVRLSSISTTFDESVDPEWVGIITRAWIQQQYSDLYEVCWGKDDSVGIYYYDELEAICK